MAYPEMVKYWDENDIPHVQQVVVTAACKLMSSSLILVGARHWDKVMLRQFRSTCPHAKKPTANMWEQGFIDQFGTFLTRTESMKIVKASGQPFNAEHNGGTIHLFSEGIH